MRNVRFNKKAMVIYLIFTFGLAYIIQICAASLYEKNRVIGQLVTAAMMFVPALGAVLSGAKLKEMGWKPQIRKNIKIFLIAWFGSMILTVVGAALYFLIFPKHFDISGEYFVVAGGAEALEQMKAQGISYSAEHVRRLGRRDRLARIHVSAAEGKIRTQEGMDPWRSDLGCMALAAYLADRV